MSSAELRRLAAQAEAAERAAVLAEVCGQVGIGVRELQGEGRTAATAKRREVVAWVLCRHRGWTVSQTATALRRTKRQTYNLLRNLAVVSASRVK